MFSIGRQSGKSTLGAMAGVHNATLRPDLDALVPHGRTRYVLAAAPAEVQAREFVTLCAAMIDASPALARLATVKTDRIDFRAGVGCADRDPGDAGQQPIRAASASMIVLDEFAHLIDTDGSASDARMFAALEPSTRVIGDLARIVILSTPFGETGRFYELFMAAEDGVMPSSRAVRAPVWEVDERLDEAWRDRKRVEVGEDTFRQEYGAEWVAGGGQSSICAASSTPRSQRVPRTAATGLPALILRSTRTRLAWRSSASPSSGPGCSSQAPSRA